MVSKYRLPAGDSGSEHGTHDLYAKILSLEADVANLGEAANKLIADKEERETSMDVNIIIIKQCFLNKI